MCIVFSLCWGAIGYFIGTLFSSSGASIVLALIGFVCGLGINLGGIEWVRDL